MFELALRWRVCSRRCIEEFPEFHSELSNVGGVLVRVSESRQHFNLANDFRCVMKRFRFRGDIRLPLRIDVGDSQGRRIRPGTRQRVEPSFNLCQSRLNGLDAWSGALCASDNKDRDEDGHNSSHEILHGFFALRGRQHVQSSTVAWRLDAPMPSRTFA